MSKRMTEALKKVEPGRTYQVEEAVDIIKSGSKVKFDETVELHVNLGIDPKQSTQIVRGTVVLPNGTGRKVKIAVIAKGEKIKEAEESGADFVGYEDLIEKIQKGWFGFDTLVATPDAMRDLARLGKILGPKGLMPNPKTGTVTFEIKKAVNELKAGRVEFRNDSAGILHCPVGKVSFDREKLVENINSLMTAVTRAKPSSAKGIYIRKVVLSSTMGPGVHVAYGAQA